MPSGPKANKFVNRHSEEARQRDEERAAAQKAAAAAAHDAAQWRETDAKVQKKLAKQNEDEQRAQEKAAREREKRQQLEQEERELNARAPKKVVQRQVQKDLTKMLANYDKEQRALRGGGGGGALVDASKAAPLPTGNINEHKSTRDGATTTAAGGGGVVEVRASGSPGAVLLALEEAGMHATPHGSGAGAAAVVHTSGGGAATAAAAAVPDDRHIGKRARVLYKAFYAEQLPRVREAHPGMRRSQYNDVVWKMWLKDPSNPFVQRSEQRDRDALAQQRHWMDEEHSSGDEADDAQRYDKHGDDDDDKQ